MINPCVTGNGPWKGGVDAQPGTTVAGQGIRSGDKKYASLSFQGRLSTCTFQVEKLTLWAAVQSQCFPIESA